MSAPTHATTNRALIFQGPYAMSLGEIEMPAVGPDDVLIRVRAVGICGSDIHGFSGKTGRRAPGMVMGHEIAGEVGEVGAAVRGTAVGQRVAVQPILFCGHCRLCREGRTSLCLNKRMLGVNMGTVGGLSDYVAVPATNVFAFAATVPFAVGSLAEPLAVGESAAAAAGIRAGETVAIVGAGMICLAILLAVKERQPARIFVVDSIDRRLALAAGLGAVPVNFRDTAAVARIRQKTGGHGADATIEAVGASASVATAQQVARDGGRIVLIGNSAKMVEVDMQDIVVRGKSIQGVYCYTNDDFARAVRYLEANEARVAGFVEKEVPPHEAPATFTKLARGELELLRAVVTQE